eukprot:873190-Ditylum_brightwellii.AAC.1
MEYLLSTFQQSPERNGGMYDAYKIFLEASPHVFSKFKMSIPLFEYPEFQGQCAILKGSSKTVWLQEHMLYQE